VVIRFARGRTPAGRVIPYNIGPMTVFDAIVIGVGGMGSAACFHLARRGASVLGLEQFTQAHDRGSSHGQTRIIRKAYFEHPDYVPLLHRTYELWAELDDQTDMRLFERCGLLLVGPPDGMLIPGCRRAAAEHRLDLEPVAPREVAKRFPGFRADDSVEALFEENAGFLRVEDCVRAHVRRAVECGADIRWNVGVRDWVARKDSVTVRTDVGDFRAGRLVVCAGPWSADLLGELRLPLEVRRKVLLWVRAAPEYRLDRGCPVFGFETELGFLYGFPADERGELKIANHGGGEAVDDPSAPDRRLLPRDAAFIAPFALRHARGIDTQVIRHSVCMYTMTPDEHFVIDRSPRSENVVFAAGFSGHGFKFAPVVGSVLADLALDGKTAEPIGFLSASRPAIGVS
jgi:sarcosine oxidase